MNQEFGTAVVSMTLPYIEHDEFILSFILLSWADLVVLPLCVSKPHTFIAIWKTLPTLLPVFKDDVYRLHLANKNILLRILDFKLCKSTPVIWCKIT